MSKRVGIACALFLMAALVFWYSSGAEKRVEITQHERLISSRDVTLAPFVSDGCSGGLSTVWNALPSITGNDLPFERCCIRHDRAYHSGGIEVDAAAGYAARLMADETLRLCVAETGGHALAEAMYRAVRLGGGPCTGFSWRWGYGRPACP